MPQSIAQIYVHLIFSTKNRKPLLDKPILHRMHAYLASVCNNMECHALSVGGIEDHVHILCSLSKKVSLSKLLEELKKNSSKWVKLQGDEYKNFYWQRGYGSFSVNPTDTAGVKKYIQNQEEHHTKRNFQEEYLELLKLHNAAYDEKYLWD